MVNQIVLHFISILFVCSTSSALRCYQCQSRDEGCLSHPPPERYLQYCDSYSVCAVMYSKEEGMDKDNVNRYCTRYDMSSGQIGHCEAMDYASAMEGNRERLRRKLCTCNDKDGCNGVGNVKCSNFFMYFMFLGTVSLIKYF